MKTWIILLLGLTTVAALAGCAEPDESINNGQGEVECDDENNIDVGAPDETTNVGGVECEDAEVDPNGGA